MPLSKPEFRDRALFARLFGADVYAVGGYVRDILRNAAPAEVDLLVARLTVEAIVEKLAPHGKVDLVGRSFGVIKFTRRGQTYDIALPRADRAPTGDRRGHKDIVVRADPGLPIEEDLRRRDFRCNSIAWALSDGRLIDPFDGRADIKARRLRVTDPAAFPEDPLRVLRAARFASVLGFRVDPLIYVLAKDINLAALSVERINEELFRILLRSPRPSIGLEELFRLGTLRRLFPELYALTLVIQDSVFHPEKDAFGHHTVWSHTKLAVDQAGRLAAAFKLEPPRALALLLAALYHDAGKAETTAWEHKRGRMVVTSVGHDIASERIARLAFSRNKIFSWNGFDVRAVALMLIRTHHRPAELWTHRREVTRKAFNRLAADAKGEIELCAYLDAADRGGRGRRPMRGLDRESRWLLATFKALGVDRETIAPLVMGRDLIKMGAVPGPALGAALKEIYRRQLDNEFRTKAGGLRLARKLLEAKP
ncbi:MAG: HD domain-containing protein [Candidatus Aminicenantes bacterium]|nr:HD domain-containing protein [Candidatus Aminicenantes bacterium]